MPRDDADTGARAVPDSLSQRRALGATLLILLGAGLTVVGLIDLILLWLPLRFGSAPWEFATLSRTLDGVPQIAVGLGLFGYGVLRHSRRSRRSVRLLSVMFGLGAAALLIVGALYLTVAPAVVTASPPEALAGLQRALVKNGAQGIVYPLVFAAIAAVLWRGTRRAR